MKKATKIGIGAAAALTAGALAFAAPSFAGSMASSFQTAASTGETPFEHGDRGHHGQHIEAELNATVTGLPETVTEVRDAALGGYWEAFELDTAATALPDAKPTEGGFRIVIHPQRADDGTVNEPTLEAGVLTGVIDIHVNETDTTKVLALYPSDGGEGVIVTVNVDADGVATATASGTLSVAYSAEVAAEAPAFGKGGFGHGHRGEGHGKGGGRGHGPHGSEDTAPTAANPNA